MSLVVVSHALIIYLLFVNYSLAASGAVDKMGKILGPAAPALKVGKRSATAFSVDMSLEIKSGMERPGFVPKHSVSFR
jgi:hypothetical protein